jgi:hypothetical protein
MFKQIALTVVFVAAFAVAANAQQSNHYASGVRNSSGPYRLNGKQLQMVRDSLRQKSGFVELGFDQDGTLTLGNRQNIAGGSATARALLQAAVDSANLYELESHERAPEVAFARIVESEDRATGATGQWRTIFQVLLDFADHLSLSGAREAKASFDPGIALLHELTQGQKHPASVGRNGEPPRFQGEFFLDHCELCPPSSGKAEKFNRRVGSRFGIEEVDALL